MAVATILTDSSQAGGFAIARGIFLRNSRKKINLPNLTDPKYMGIGVDQTYFS
jgi:hypothetical protein